MKTILLLLLAISFTASADVYKCGKTYQSTPCNLDSPDSSKVEIKTQTEEQKAASAERLQQVRSEYETNKQLRQEADEKAFDKSVRMAELEAAQNNAREQARQADALEKEADKPVPIIYPPGFHQTIPPRRR